MKHIISMGAGVQSSTMALMAAKGLIKPMPDCAIFADTGWEPSYVYEWLDWLETLLPFPVYRVNNGNLKDDLALIPFFTSDQGLLSRNCTTNHKIRPLLRKVRDILGLKKGQRGGKEVRVTQWIGISLDEVVRMKPAPEKWIKHRWPLIDLRMTRNDCLKWMKENGYPEPKKSSCIGCPYHDDTTWREMKLNQPEEWQDAVEVDRAIRDGVRGTTKKLFLHRSCKPLEEVDLDNLEDKGQLNLFENECEGMCGV